MKPASRIAREVWTHPGWAIHAPGQLHPSPRVLVKLLSLVLPWQILICKHDHSIPPALLLVDEQKA